MEKVTTRTFEDLNKDELLSLLRVASELIHDKQMSIDMLTLAHLTFDAEGHEVERREMGFCGHWHAHCKRVGL